MGGSRTEAPPKAGAPWTYSDLMDLRSRTRAMGANFDLRSLAIQTGRTSAEVDVALFALMGRSLVDACKVLA